MRKSHLRTGNFSHYTYMHTESHTHTEEELSDRGTVELALT